MRRSIFFGALILLGWFIALPSPATAQSLDDAPRWTLAARAQLSETTSLTVGGLLLPDLNTNVPFAFVDHQLDARWGIQAGYFLGVTEIESAPDRTTQFIRLGVTYRRPGDALTFDNRLLHEIVIDDDDRLGGRVRNRARLTYALAGPDAGAPRVFGYVEPILEYGLGRSSRADLALGAGFTPGAGLHLDVYGLRQEFLDRPHRRTANATMIQILVDLRRR